MTKGRNKPFKWPIVAQNNQGCIAALVNTKTQLKEPYEDFSLYPIKKQGNLLGFLKLEMNIVEGNTVFPLCFDVTIMRNSHNGQLFVMWPSKPFQTPEGTTKYAPIMRWVREQADAIQQAVLDEFRSYCAIHFKDKPQEAPPAPEETPPVYPYAENELPF